MSASKRVRKVIQSDIPHKKPKSINDMYSILGIDTNTNRFENENKLSFQHIFRCLCIGKTGAGKSSVVLSNLFLGTPNPITGVRVSNVSECDLFTGSSSVDDALYTLLENKFPDNFHLHSLKDFPQWLEELKSAMEDLKRDGKDMTALSQRLVIFDDFVGSPDLSKSATSFVLYARKLNCSVCLLSQSFKEIDKTTRDNMSGLILMHSLSKQQLDQIWKLCEVVTGIKREEFLEVYRTATNVYTTQSGNQFDAYLVVDLTPECEPCMRFRQTFLYPIPWSGCN
jgi:hypothetical protein